MITKPKPNIETRIAARLQSVFASIGSIITDFYLEAGIYFVGGFNALLVAWSLYVEMLSSGQPLPYAIILAIAAFIAVEGLSIFLVGAAAKTNSSLLWFFSVVFACFFTYAHYKEMTGNAVISEYITLAIPFFVVVGYWARTVKVGAENDADRAAQEHDSEAARQHQIEDQERQRKQEIEDENRQFDRQLAMDKLSNQHEINLAKNQTINGQNGDNLAKNEAKLAKANSTKKDKIGQRRKTILSIMSEEKLTQTELAKRLGVSVGTIKTDLKSFNGSLINS